MISVFIPYRNIYFYRYRDLKKEFIPIEVELFWQLKNITMRFPGVVALNDVSLDIYKVKLLA